MAKNYSISKTSIGRKILMALSALFLMLFLLQHLSINMLSVISADAFNEVSQFMGANPVVQFILQPILIFAVVFHFVMGFYLEAKNRAAREVKYYQYKGSANASWMSRNMLISGLVILAFLGLHFYDFWIPEINVKYIQGDMSGLNEAGEFRFYEELVHKFTDPIRVVIYCVAFVLLSLHLLHGFQSAFQSVGVNTPKVTPFLMKLGKAYSIVVPLGFVFIALFHFLNH
jgi:succinate dehydrogenase / fumarate reductase cytochrome b subunit